MSSIDEIFSTFDEALSNVPILYNGNTFNRVDEVDSVNKVKSIKRLTVNVEACYMELWISDLQLKVLRSNSAKRIQSLHPSTCEWPDHRGC